MGSYRTKVGIEKRENGVFHATFQRVSRGIDQLGREHGARPPQPGLGPQGGLVSGPSWNRLAVRVRRGGSRQGHAPERVLGRRPPLPGDIGERREGKKVLEEAQAGPGQHSALKPLELCIPGSDRAPGSYLRCARARRPSDGTSPGSVATFGAS